MQKKYLLSIVFIILLTLAVTITASFAYFTANITGLEETTSVAISGGIMSINYTSGSNINILNIYPKEEPWVIKEFTLDGDNSSSSDMKYIIKLNITSNTFTENALKYTLTSENTNNNGGVIPNISVSDVPSSSINLGTGLFTGPTITSKRHKYTLKIYFPETGKDQNIDQNKEFKAYIQVLSEEAIYAESNPESKSGVELKFLNSYNYGSNLSLDGLTTQEEGATITSPKELKSSSNFDLISSIGRRNLLTNSEREVSSNNSSYSREFIQYADLAPIFDFYGLVNYSMSVDLKSLDISQSGGILIYMQNGSSAKYSFISISRSVTTTYKRYLFENYIPTINDASLSQAFLAFYGTYGTGNFPSAKKVKIELGPESSPWTPALEDVNYNEVTKGVYKINLPITLRSSGGIKDSLFKDNDGLWKINRKIYTEELDSSSTMVRYYESYDNSVKSNRSFTPVKKIKSQNEKCSHFSSPTSEVWGGSKIGFKTNNNYQFHISFPNDLLGILSSDGEVVRNTKIKAFLDSEKNKGTPVTILYELETPIIEVLSNDMQNKLNGIPTFNGTTYMYTLGDVSPNINATIRVEK